MAGSFPQHRVRAQVLVGASLSLLLSIAVVMKASPTQGLTAYQERAKPEIVLGEDKITPRKAAMLRMGLLTMSHRFCTAAELAANSPAAIGIWGQPCPSPSPTLLAKDQPPSTALMPEQSRYPTDVTEVSIVCKSKDLFDPEKGIVMHPLQRGKDSERPAWITARKNGSLLLESPMGLRIHGGHSRGAEEKSFTAVFRENYSGFGIGPPGLFFGEDTPAARQFILINGWHPSRFNGALATEIAALAGCNTSRLTPTIVYLNGTRLKSPYFLYQQQSPAFVTATQGIKHPDWYRLKGINLVISKRFNTFRNWVRRSPAPMAMQEAAKYYDLNDLSNWALTMTFTATTDNNQGAYFTDADNPGATWRSLTWDMDFAFNDATHKTDTGWIDYSRDPFAGLLGYRAELFLRLFRESPQYRARFMSLAKQKLANELHPDKLTAMADRYIRLAAEVTSPDSTTTKVMRDSREFLATRHHTFLQYLEQKAKDAALADHSLARKASSDDQDSPSAPPSTGEREL